MSLVDLPPTLLDAAGLEVPDEMQGESILPLLRGETDDWQEEVFVQISEAQVGRAVRTQRWNTAWMPRIKMAAEMPDLTGMSSSISMTSKRIPTSYGTLLDCNRTRLLQQ